MAKTSLKRLKLFSFKLDLLLQVTQEINKNPTQEELLAKYQKILQEDLNIGQIVIFKYIEDTWHCILKAGVVNEKDVIEHIDVARDLLQYKEISNVTTTENRSLRHFDFLIPVYHNNTPISFVLIGDIAEEMDGISPTIKHLHFIQTLSNIIMVAIENIRLYKENLRREALKKELEFASQMQSMLIPSPERLPQNEKLHVKTFYYPHYEIGGDYYDFLQLNDHTIGFCIADVSGKGIPAALFMSNFQANLRTLFTEYTSLRRIVEKLNKRVYDTARGEKFITLFIAKADLNTNKLEYINAGHNPPLFYSVTDNTIRYLTEGCTGLGMVDTIPSINKGKLKLQGKNKILCYTDGLVELAHKNRVTYELHDIVKALSNKRDIAENIEHIIQSHRIDKHNPAIFDDVSIIGLEFLK